MRRRQYLKSVASIPGFSVLSSISTTRESKNRVVNMRYQKRMDYGSLRMLQNGEVAKDIQIQNRKLWRMSADYYSRKFGISIPSIRGFDLHKFLLHEDKFWSIGYQRPQYILHMINSVDGPFRSMLYDIRENENVAVVETDDFRKLVRKTRLLPQEHIE